MMSYYSKDTIDSVKKIDLLTYLKNVEPDELVLVSKDTYTTRTHDSLRISNGMWNWFSRGIGGKTALEYLIQVKGYNFTEAVRCLLNNHIDNDIIITENKEDIKTLKLPIKADNNRKVKQYLMNRGISENIIEECIEKGIIYQESKTNNVVFLGLDENNIPKYASLRGTNSSRFMGEASGSDKRYSFKLLSDNKNDSVHLFECAIDLLSYATLCEMDNKEWYKENLMSLAGVYKTKSDPTESKLPVALLTYLKNNPNTRRIYLHFDNDTTGRGMTYIIQSKLKGIIDVIDEPPKVCKDYNDFLCFKLNNYNRKIERER